MANILIVDDDRVLVGALCALVEQRFPDAVVEKCTSADESLHRIREHDYDVLVSDIRMPKVDGMTLLGRVHETRPDVPVIMITGIGDYEVALRALRLGAFDFIPKPVDTDYFAAAIARAIHVRAISRELEERRTSLERRAEELASVVERQTHQLREANRAKDEFLATVSHELRTPLTTVLGWSRLLLKGSTDASTLRQGIEAIERNATHQARLVEDLLDVCRIMTGKLRVAKKSARFGQIVRSVLETMAPVMKARDIECEHTIDAVDVCVSGDADRLQQIVSNLLSNAIKFTPAGGWIKVEVAEEGADVVLRVRDSGIGMSREFLPHVFDRFRQADSTTARSRGGLGVGLAIVQHLVAVHGGTVEAQSNGADKGSTFIVRLPVLEERESVPPPAPDSETTLEGLSLLLVDDDEDTLALFRHALEYRGAAVRTAGSAARAMEELERARPDVLVCDIGMPEQDGYALIRSIRAKAALCDVPAVAVTAFTRPEDVRHALSEGFNLHIAKPVEMDDLAMKVQDLGRRAHRR